MQFYISKPFALGQQIALAGGSAAVTLGCGYLAAKLYASGAAATWIMVLLGLALLGVLLLLFASWRFTKNWLRLARMPLIAFGADEVSWRSTPDDSAVHVAPLSSISGVECEIYATGTAYAAFVRIQRWASPSIWIDITLLKASPTEVFNAFKDRLPALVQPQPEVHRLIAGRYASMPSR